jgi:hypothetical protein
MSFIRAGVAELADAPDSKIIFWLFFGVSLRQRKHPRRLINKGSMLIPVDFKRGARNTLEVAQKVAQRRAGLPIWQGRGIVR